MSFTLSILALFARRVKQRARLPLRRAQAVGVQTAQILRRPHGQAAATAAVLALQQDIVAEQTGRQRMTAAGAAERALRHEVVQAVHGREQTLLPLHKEVALLGVQRIKLRRVEIEKRRKALPFADLAELKRVMLTVEFFEAQPPELPPGKAVRHLLATDAAGYSQLQPLPRP